ncbi:hypothetical protein Taro_035753 [Colocasia esculenta]|uniref:Transposase (putative) gypsy type domain-containing protein n=1 Tax=Colocasia esculenta TaxID=4460 RepID=A0A843VZS0_COLES|nr:hypothetical protein [Colocasia esculenta]
MRSDVRWDVRQLTRLLMMGRVTWGGYNRCEDSKSCSEVSGGGYRAGVEPYEEATSKGKALMGHDGLSHQPASSSHFLLLLCFFLSVRRAVRLPVMAQKGKEIIGASGTPPVKTKAVKLRSFEGLRERFQIGEEYDIVLMREDESYLTTRPGCFVLSLDLLEAGLRLPMPEIAKELLRSWKVAPIQLTPNSWRSIFVFCIICKKRGIEATASIFRSHFSLACSPQSGMGIVYVKHRTNRMRINFSPCLSNNKGWTGRLFFVGPRKGANVPEWEFPVRVAEPLKRTDMTPFWIQGAAAASQSLNTVGVNHVEGYLTEYKLVKYKLSPAWGKPSAACFIFPHTWVLTLLLFLPDAGEVAAGRGQKEMANYAETIPISLHLIRLDEDAPVKESGAVSSEGPPVKFALYEGEVLSTHPDFLSFALFGWKLTPE